MIIKEFIEFLREYKIVSFAIWFVMATASTALVNSFVKDILMLVAAPLFSSEPWRDAISRIGPMRIVYGAFLAELLNFIFLGLVVFLIAKKIPRAVGLRASFARCAHVSLRLGQAR